jgi:GNAT superfamily N-acetyltransferase
MSTPWQIRRATTHDAQQILDVSDQATIWLVERGFGRQWGPDPPSTEEAYVNRVNGWAREGQAMVAIDPGGTIQGFIVAGTDPPPYLDAGVATRAIEDAAYVYTMISRMTPQSRGVGRALLDWARDWASRRGVTYLRLDCWADNPGLREYYHRAGFFECEAFQEDDFRGVVMELEL